MQPEPQPADQREIRQTALDILLRAVGEYSGTLKLVLGLSTGAAVLLINVLANQHLPPSASWLFVTSVLFFGAAAILCMLLMLALAQVKLDMCEALIDHGTNWRQKFDAKMDAWKRGTATIVKSLAWLFGLGLLFAAASVIALILIR